MRKLYLLLTVPLLMIGIVSCNLFDNDSTPLFTLSTNVSPAEGGVITPADGEFEEGEELEIQAEPNEGYSFVRWEGDEPTESNPATITFDTNKDVVAVFSRKEYTLEVNVDGEGSVNEHVIQKAAKTDYEHGTTVELVAVPGQGWSFAEWQGDISGTENPSTIEVVDEGSVTAVFDINEYVVNINVEGEGNVVTEPEQNTYEYGEDITFTAEPIETWRFQEWQGDITGNDPTATIEGIDSEKNITAVFVPVEDPLWAMGYNHNGQLGAGSQTEHHDPVRNIYSVDRVTAGAFHSLFIKTDGTLWGMGFNNYGQLGDGTDEDQHDPIQINSEVNRIAAGEHHSLFIKEDGTLWAMGQNVDGQLGDGSVTDQLRPIQVDSDVVEVAAGAWHSLYVKSDGTLWAMGRNNFGQLGDGTQINKIEPVQIDTDVKTVAGGKRHSLYIKNDGTLYGMGRNAAGQLGIGTDGDSNLPKADQSTPVQIDTDVATVTGGTDHTLYAKSDGSLWTMGQNEFGQLGDGTTSSRSSPVQVASDAIEVAAGNRHSLYLSSDGTLWGMGYNGNGQLGDGTTEHKQQAIQIDTEVNSIAAGINHSLYIHD